MCGVFGWFSPGALEEQSAQQALDSLAHRGPDDRGAWISSDKKLFLGHRRLSILDLSPAGRQPMTNEDGTLWLTYNGEIYNFRELREELIAKGHRFASKTDTEVILHLYEEEGEDFVHRLIGMFAFALYDARAQRLLLVRDRLGIKPLYYADYGGHFLFASEIKAILAAGIVPIAVDWQAILDYFTFLFVPHPQTAFQAIRQLPPATMLTYDFNSRKASLHRYWTPWDSSFGQGPISHQELKDRLRGLLDDAVKSELISDVPLGVLFSGGIDSTLLASIMARHSKEPVKTFTVGFRGPGIRSLDDLPYARLASKALGTDHRELIVDLTAKEDLIGMVRFFDQPFANPTFYLQYRIAHEMRRFVTVALSGVGADELFGGYPKYRLFPWSSFLRRLPAAPSGVARRLLGLVREDAWSPVLRRAKRILKGIGLPLHEQYTRWSYYLTEEEKKRLLRKDVFESLHPASRIIKGSFENLHHGAGLYEKVFCAELQTFLAGNLLEYTDKATMAVALETRVPFLDHRLVELSARIPFSDKIRWGKAKAILLETFRDRIPSAIAAAPKRGFSPPMAHWMDAVLDRYFDDVLTQEAVKRDGIFSWEEIQHLRRDHRSRRRDASMELLGLIMFDAWYHRYIDRQQPIPSGLCGA